MVSLDQDNIRAEQIEDMGQRTGDFVNGNKHLADLRYWFGPCHRRKFGRGLLPKGGTTQLEGPRIGNDDSGSVEHPEKNDQTTSRTSRKQIRHARARRLYRSVDAS